MTVQELRTPEQIIRLRYQRKGDSFFCGEILFQSGTIPVCG